ncbi:TraB/GumN family protein [Photobacterium sp.]|uniref:TraB/GumN family protein n=1 Tax=Photobacterium sp. TaxID=660 RepID=UPI00299DECD3|nr:TraB/GumN family protein [Photobacterium sp.]MDX1304292.1 TraB/GumN family protein [Photobacterium sp.]
MFKSLLSKALLILPFFSNSALAEPIVWLAKDAQRQFVILGSIHAGTDTMYPLPKAFLQQWQSADGLIVEANILNPPPMDIETSGPTSHSQLTTEEMQKLTDIANQLNLPYRALSDNPPWLTVVSLQMALANHMGLNTEQGIDYILLKRADNQGLPIFELESIEQQLTLLQDLPDHGKEMLVSTINEWEQMRGELSCLIEAWQTGDSQQLIQLFEESHYSDETDNRLIFNRNKHWADTLANDKQYQQGHYMVVVGAFHLFGEQGLPNLLKQRGFTVTRLTQEMSANCD